MKFLVLSALLIAVCAGNALADAPEPAPTPLVTLEAGTSSESLSKGRGMWNDSYLVYVHRTAPRSAAYAMFSQSHRFGSSDPEYLAGVYLPASANTILNLEVSVSPTHQVLASSEIGMSLDHRLDRGFGYTIGTAHRTYPGLEVQGESMLVDRYWGSERASYKLSAVQLSNVIGYSFTHSVSYSHYYGMQGLSHITAALSAGRDAENVGTGVLISSVSSASLGGTHWFDQQWALTWLATTTRQGSLYSRSGIQLGLRRRL
ncbi:MAG: YaiO family outer membrane beta-barrel protein [Candidatus Eremiobacteraeota bacterium]|nr:YaiO family outer membrane beta-barrel protein [Candidatus Eremiobacteraeota bacterium]